MLSIQKFSDKLFQLSNQDGNIAKNWVINTSTISSNGLHEKRFLQTDRRQPFFQYLGPAWGQDIVIIVNKKLRVCTRSVQCPEDLRSCSLYLVFTIHSMALYRSLFNRAKRYTIFGQQISVWKENWEHI